jgi:hypothetical protein
MPKNCLKQLNPLAEARVEALHLHIVNAERLLLNAEMLASGKITIETRALGVMVRLAERARGI